MEEKQLEEKTWSELWAETEPPQYEGRYLYGTKDLTKMRQFLIKHPMTNKDIDAVMALRPTVEEVGGDKEYAKQFGKFQRALLKWRAQVYHFPKKVSLKNEPKNKKQKNESQSTKQNRAQRRAHLQTK